jgi:hypothetical protein
VFWVISVYFNIRNTLLKSGTFLLGHPVYNLKNKTFENRLLRRIFGHRVDEIMEGSNSVELDSFYLLPNYLSD